MAIETFVRTLLADRGKEATLAPDDAIFTSGLLDSLAATELMLHLEAEYGVDLADADFDIGKLDTLADLQGLTAA